VRPVSGAAHRNLLPVRLCERLEARRGPSSVDHASFDHPLGPPFDLVRSTRGAGSHQEPLPLEDRRSRTDGRSPLPEEPASRAEAREVARVADGPEGFEIEQGGRVPRAPEVAEPPVLGDLGPRGEAAAVRTVNSAQRGRETARRATRRSRRSRRVR